MKHHHKVYGCSALGILFAWLWSEKIVSPLCQEMLHKNRVSSRTIKVWSKVNGFWFCFIESTTNKLKNLAMFSQVSLFPYKFSTVTLCTNFSPVKQWEEKCTWRSVVHEAVGRLLQDSPASESQMGCPNLPFFRIPFLVQAQLLWRCLSLQFYSVLQ